jgi:hypothetical protein
MNYKGQTRGPHMPVFRDIFVEQVTCKKAGTAIDCQGLPGHPIQRITLRNVTVEAAGTPLKTGDVEGLKLDNVKVNNSTVVAQ